MTLRDNSVMDLNGFVDMHIHTSPDVRPRFADDVDTVRAAAEAGLRAVLIKSHVTLTADRAALAEKVVGGIRVFGALALNFPVGGLNPVAVEIALKMGARQIWMPTLNAANHHREHGGSGGISIFDETGKVKPGVREIVDIVGKADVILGSGHLSIEETRALVKLAQERGLRKILVTHPEALFIRMSASTQMEIAGEGMFFERCYVNTTKAGGASVTVEEIATQIREVGIESTVLSTDFGQDSNPAPVAGMRAYLSSLRECGFSKAELRSMAGETPAYLLGI